MFSKRTLTLVPEEVEEKELGGVAFVFIPFATLCCNVCAQWVTVANQAGGKEVESKEGTTCHIPHWSGIKPSNHFKHLASPTTQSNASTVELWIMQISCGQRRSNSNSDSDSTASRPREKEIEREGGREWDGLSRKRIKQNRLMYKFFLTSANNLPAAARGE